VSKDMLWSLMYLERYIAMWPNEGIAFLLGFLKAMQYLSNCQKDIIWSPNYFKDT
jgi:hypothetical protein